MSNKKFIPQSLKLALEVSTHEYIFRFCWGQRRWGWVQVRNWKAWNVAAVKQMEMNRDVEYWLKTLPVDKPRQAPNWGPLFFYESPTPSSWRHSGGNPKHSNRGKAFCLPVPPLTIFKVLECEVLSKPSTWFNICTSQWWSPTTRLRDADHSQLISWAFCFLLQFVKLLLKGWSTNMLSMFWVISNEPL